jgi:hypothetical protein
MSPRTKFVMIFLLFSLPFVGSTITFLVWKPSVTNNYGELLSPIIALPETKLNRIDSVTASTAVGSELIEKSFRGKWLMLTRDSGACEAACRKKLYAMRQARLSLGREQDRVLRVVLVDDEIAPSAALVAEFQGTIWISAKAVTWLALLPSADGNTRNHLYGVDTLGNVFIRYNADPDIKRMMKDFQRVLKASQIG